MTNHCQYSIIILVTENIMSKRPRTIQKLTPPTAEEWRLRNREARAKKRQELAEQIAERITPMNCETIIELADEIRELADNIQYYRKLDIEVQYLTIIELQNHIHELQTYLVRIEETAIGMHD
jgi:TRAP-type C4-dicarboxylate transport system substrate-binding protein